MWSFILCFVIILAVNVAYSEIAHSKTSNSNCGTWPRPSSGGGAPQTLSPPSSSVEPSPTTPVSPSVHYAELAQIREESVEPSYANTEITSNHGKCD